MNDNDAIAVLLVTAMNDANGIVNCKIESAINLSKKRVVHYNRNKSIIYCFDVLSKPLLTYSSVLSDTAALLKNYCKRCRRKQGTSKWCLAKKFLQEPQAQAKANFLWTTVSACGASSTQALHERPRAPVARAARERCMKDRERLWRERHASVSERCMKDREQK